MKSKLLLLLVLFVSFYSVSLKAQQEMFINEIMASNDTTIADNTAEYEDWIELYNSTADPIVLDGYYISNDINNPLKFRFTGNLLVPANGYLILWASNDITRGATHLPFKVSASGESLYLYLPDGITLADSMSIGKQKTDISYGRNIDGSTELSFFANPTPGASNNTSQGYLGILNAPVFSVNAGFYPSPFSLNISSDNANANIIYTLDASTPDSGNLNGTVYRYKNKYQQYSGDLPGPFLSDSFRSISYTNPLTIQDASTKPNRLSIKSSTSEAAPNYYPTTLINKGTVVRAIAIKEGYISSEVKTATYFVTPGGINRYTLPVLSLATSEDNLFSWDKGIYNAGTDYEQWRALNPTGLLNGGQGANWARETEITASLELFTPHQTSLELQTNVGLTINGSFSSAKQQKAFRVYFRSSYGASNLNYPLLPDLPYKNYERLVLSNAGQDMNTVHMRDMVIQASVKHLKFETSHATPAITFVNGEFWGFLNARERYDDNYFDRVYGIKQAELDFLEDQLDVKDGTDNEIVSLRNFFTANDISLPQNYAAVQTRMDIENYIDYQIAETFFGNTDWPGNNQIYFRKRTAFTPDAPYGQDGRFRWLAIDFDRAMGSYGALGTPGSNGVTFNTLSWATGTRTGTNPPAWSTLFIRKLLTNIDFRNKFITRYADLINTTFRPANIDSVIYSYRDMMAPHIAEHLQRWRHFTVNVWNDSINNLIKFADQRPFYVKQHLREYFSLSSEQELTVDVSNSTHGFIRVNTIDITPAFPGVPQNTYPWKGLYYPEIPVTLVAKPKDGHRFVRWEGDSTSTEDSIVINLSAAKSFKAIFESTDVPVSKVFNYWDFNNLPTGALTSVVADSSLPGNAVITYVGTGAGYIDRVDPGSMVNVKFEQPAGFGLRPRNPSATRSLFIITPTTNYKDIVLTYAVTRTSSGAEYQRVFYTTDGIEWQMKTDSILVSTPETTFGLQTIDFSTDANTADNPAFAVRIEFFGNNAAGTSGNNRFDNIAFSGIPLSVNELPAVTISSDKTTVCTTSIVTFTAAATNAGESVSFQWKRNSVNAGTNSNSYTDGNFANGDTVYCVLTVGTTSVTSNKIIVVVVPSPVVIITLSKTPASACAADGQISINGTGGALPYQYSLGGEDYVPLNVFMGLAEGSYTAYIRDAKGCAATFTDVLTKVSPLVITSLSKTQASACTNDGRISINSSGGTLPYQYSLNNVDYFTSNLFTNLAAGNYTAYVKDARGCITTFTDVLTKYSPIVITSLNITSVSACGNNSDGRISISRTGGTYPQLYSLNNVDYFTSNIFSNLPVGTYTAYVKDARGCMATFTGVLTKASPLRITSVIRTQPSSCPANGKLTINRTGGSSPFVYSLNDVNYVSANVFSNLAVGTYTAYVKDVRGCKTSVSGIVLTGPVCREASVPAVKEKIVISTKLRIKVFPNPSAEQFSVIAESSNNSEVELVVTDLAGRRLLYTRTAPNTVFSIGKQLSSGMYFIEALQGKERATLKIVKIK